MANTCREFQGARDGHGYGKPSIGPPRQKPSGAKNGRRQVRLHRWVMEQALGRPLLPSEVVRHTCDNPPCFLLEHLRLGTQADNMADMDAKGRRRVGRLRGSQKPNARLTEADVREIRRLAGSSRVLGQRFGVSAALIRDVRRGKVWRHV